MEVLHVPPRRRGARSSACSEQNRSLDCEIQDSFDVSEAEKAAVAKKLQKGEGKAVRAPVARRKVSQ